MKTFRSNGKLLITGEYTVLDNALALAIPTKFGQTLEVITTNSKTVNWTALKHDGELWFKAILKIEDIKNGSKSDLKTKEEIRLLEILQVANTLNPEVLLSETGLDVTTRLEFPQNWGLGSSSTLINNIAQWFEVDAYQLLSSTFKGSGYDIAAANSNFPITYQLTESGRSILTSNFNPTFQDELFFVHLNQKQNSRESIAHYKAQSKESLVADIEKISGLTRSFITCENLEEFKILMNVHETITSKLINTPKIKTQLFPDFNGAIKSLGGWGGDFILATGNTEAQGYFRNKGFSTILTYSEMAL